MKAFRFMLIGHLLEGVTFRTLTFMFLKSITPYFQGRRYIIFLYFYINICQYHLDIFIIKSYYSKIHLNSQFTTINRFEIICSVVYIYLH